MQSQDPMRQQQTGPWSPSWGGGREDGGSRSNFPDLDPTLRSPHTRHADIIHGARLSDPADVESEPPIRLHRPCRACWLAIIAGAPHPEGVTVKRLSGGPESP